jgi:hypothetical protein
MGETLTFQVYFPYFSGNGRYFVARIIKITYPTLICSIGVFAHARRYVPRQSRWTVVKFKLLEFFENARDVIFKFVAELTFGDFLCCILLFWGWE